MKISFFFQILEKSVLASKYFPRLLKVLFGLWKSLDQPIWSCLRVAQCTRAEFCLQRRQLFWAPTGALYLKIQQELFKWWCVTVDPAVGHFSNFQPTFNFHINSQKITNNVERKGPETKKTVLKSSKDKWEQLWTKSVVYGLKCKIEHINSHIFPFKKKRLRCGVNIFLILSFSWWCIVWSDHQ